MSNHDMKIVFAVGCAIFVLLALLGVLTAGWAGISPLGGLLVWGLFWGAVAHVIHRDGL